MDKDRIKLLKESVLDLDAVQRDMKNCIFLHTKTNINNIKYWLENAQQAYGIGEVQLAKDCINRSLIILGE